ncbi:DUF1190 domain-containing protein [Salipiger sp. IMCC34102]|uniref:DUF1190 domain-containing protein n=1 Tax=Salipiger sp. IMCC34102 TaxID=2510647 RepID=UPI00101CBAA3|nr:DUF1190 domain-containing protein [Salipiger sp. IMCC34102]RYH00932.1 DUF1190 domain-containing protein [Salipiger sp. IMCC34102]
MTITRTDTRRKRSRAANVALMGAAAFALAACEDDAVETSVFPDLESCVSAAEQQGSWYTQAECESAFAEATAAHDEQAPRYDSQALCEEEHNGDCIVEERAGGGSVFLPLMTGYLIGNMMAQNRGIAAQPLVNTKSGSFATPAGTVINTNRGAGNLRSTSFRSAPSTKTAAPMTRATVRSTGGFGGTAAGRTFGG